MFKQVISNTIKGAVNVTVRFRHRKSLCPNPCDVSKCEKITICGASNPLGRHLAFLLKKQDVFKEVALYDEVNVRGLALDLEHMNSRTKIKPNSGDYTLRNAIRHSDIVVITDGFDLDVANCKQEALRQNAERIYKYGLKIASTCPDCLVCILTAPINVMVPLFSEAMRSCGFYDPNKIFGSCALPEMRANSVVGEYLGIDPAGMVVPVVGGATTNTIVPLLSHSKPFNEFRPNEAQKLIESILEIPEKCANFNTAAPLSAAYAATRFLVTLAKGYCGFCCPVLTAFVRSDVMPQVKYFASGIRISTKGAVANMGLPKISDTEMNYLTTSLTALEAEINLALNLFDEIHREARREEIEEMCTPTKPFVIKTPCPQLPPCLPDVCNPKPPEDPCAPAKPEYVPSVCCCPK